MNVRDAIRLILLAGLWGGSFLFMRIGAPVLGPFVLIEFRVLLAGVTLILIGVISHHQVHILHKWKYYLVLGATNAAIPFTLISFAELRINAGLAAVLNATTPMFTVLVAWIWVKETFTLKKWCGVILGIVGVQVLVGWYSGESGPYLWMSMSFSLLASVFYSIAGVFSSKYFRGEKPMDLTIGQQLSATLILLPFCLATFPHEIPSGVVIFSVIGLAVFCTAVAYLLYFALIHSVGAVKTLSVTFLIPVFGLVWGWLFLNEQITFHLILGLLIILTSVAFVVNVKKRPT